MCVDTREIRTASEEAGGRTLGRLAVDPDRGRLVCMCRLGGHDTVAHDGWHGFKFAQRRQSRMRASLRSYQAPSVVPPTNRSRCLRVFESKAPLLPDQSVTPGRGVHNHNCMSLFNVSTRTTGGVGICRLRGF